MNNLINDLTNLTTIPDNILLKLFKKIIYCCCEQIEEDILAEKEISELDIGIGTLYVKLDKNDLKYKFIPNEVFSQAVSNTVASKLNLLENTLNTTFANKIINTYKDLC